MKKHEDDDFIIVGPDEEKEKNIPAPEPEEFWLGDDTDEERPLRPHQLPVEKDTEFGDDEAYLSDDEEPEEYEPEEEYDEEDEEPEEDVCESGEYGEIRVQEPPKGKRKRRFFAGDSVLWVIIITLLIFSIFITFSAQYYKVASPAKTLVWQFIFIGVGIAALWLVHIIKYQFYRRIAKVVWWAGMILTFAAYVYGKAKGLPSTRDLSLFGISFQPLELLKIGMVMLLAMQLAGRQKNINGMKILPSFRPSEWKRNAQEQMDILTKQTIPILGPIFLTCLLTIIAVGNSTTLLIGVTCVTMLFIGRVRKQDMLKLMGLAAVAGVALFLIGTRSDTGKSRLARFTPEMHIKHSKEITTTDADSNRVPLEIYDPPINGYEEDGKPITESEQATTAKMAIASGEIMGKGPGMSTLRSKLPEAEKDYAYALLIEEFGAIGGLLVMLLFLWLFFRTIQIFKKCGTAFPSLLILGLGVMITLQAMMHMLVNVGLFPVAGQQLPLISKGGSSLVFTLFALGMILGVSRQTANNTLDAPKDQSLFER